MSRDDVDVDIVDVRKVASTYVDIVKQPDHVTSNLRRKVCSNKVLSQ